MPIESDKFFFFFNDSDYNQYNIAIVLGEHAFQIQLIKLKCIVGGP